MTACKMHPLVPADLRLCHSCMYRCGNLQMCHSVHICTKATDAHLCHLCMRKCTFCMYLQICFSAIDASIYQACMVLPRNVVLRIGGHLTVAILLEPQLQLPQLQQQKLFCIWPNREWHLQHVVQLPTISSKHADTAEADKDANTA